MSSNTTRVAVLGATGYVGGQLLAILAGHPAARVTVATTVRHAGQTLADVHPALAPLGHLPLEALDTAAIADRADVVLSALPHGESAAVLGELVDAGLMVADLSADYRFADPAAYAAAYGHPHPRPDLAARAVYGLVEFNRAAIRASRLVGVPGCYPTATLLALLPALQGGLIDPAQGVVVDAKSGISGAGRDAKTQNLFCEVDGGVRAYNVGTHRHQPEMAFQAAALGGRAVPVFFTPQVVPMSRGILASVYARLAPGVTEADLRAAYHKAYAGTPFGQVLPEGSFPNTRQVAGTNRFAVGITADRETGQAALLCVIDNLVKGAAGQAIQCMNLMLGLPEETGLPVMGGVA
ncbi:MAG: N-acetyl-gamma-glutamyl-phosphate reductase [Nitrospirae bacterium]|nr:N-acetyl-gamma-glutamyl-phosphate reductase [Nitrospirota bacterium]